MNLDLALSVLLIFTAACYVVMGMRLVASKRELGSVPIGVLLVVVSIWVMGGAIELLSSTFAVFTIGRTGHFIGTALVPIVAYVCFREYTGSTTPVRTLVLLLVIPMISVVLAATNAQHEVMWFLPIANEAGEFLTRPDRWGPWFLLVHLPYSYAVIGAAILTLIALISLAGCAGSNSYAQQKPDVCLKEDPRFNATSCIDHYRVELTRTNSSSD